MRWTEEPGGQDLHAGIELREVLCARGPRISSRAPRYALRCRWLRTLSPAGHQIIPVAKRTKSAVYLGLRSDRYHALDLASPSDLGSFLLNRFLLVLGTDWAF